MEIAHRASAPPGAAPDAAFDAAEDCVLCLKRFHAFRRKHRCTSCGRAVCGSCAKTHKPINMMPTPPRLVLEGSRICDSCVQAEAARRNELRRQEEIERARARQLAAMEEEQRMRDAEIMRRDQLAAEKRARDEMAKRMRLRDLELRHFGGPRQRNRPMLSRCRSLDDGARLRETQQGDDRLLLDAMRRSRRITQDYDGEVEVGMATRARDSTQNLLDEAPVAMSIGDATVVASPMPEECAICLEELSAGNAIYTTACGHTFHWQCLKETEHSNASNYGTCPSCRAEMPEMKNKRECDHPRVRAGHRFCRDCGERVTERDAKPRASQMPPTTQQGPLPMRPNGGMLPPTMSYRAGLHGALVRCPQCQMQMRVLPHMYNMRVRCTRGHIFFVQVAGQPNSWSRRPSVPTPLATPGMSRLGNASAYPRGVFLYRPTANASQM